MVISKTQSSEIKDPNWFMFAMGLRIRLFSDYVSLKLISKIEPTISIPTRFVMMIEIVEKALKLYLAMHEMLDHSLSHYSNEDGHNIEKLRAKAETFNDIFADADVKQFAKPFNDKAGALYQHLRYGSQKNIDGFSTNLGVLMPIVEKIFYNCILRLDENDKKLVNNSSLLFSLITGSQLDQSYNRELLLEAVKLGNPYYDEYADYCKMLDHEQKMMIEQFSTSLHINENNKPAAI